MAICEVFILLHAMHGSASISNIIYYWDNVSNNFLTISPGYVNDYIVYQAINVHQNHLCGASDDACVDSSLDGSLGVSAWALNLFEACRLPHRHKYRQSTKSHYG